VVTEVGTVLGDSIAPAVAARRQETALELADLLDPVTRAARSRPAGRLVVEGAGGLLVELGTDGTTCADLAMVLAYPLVVVARPGLGTLNHTALTLAEADRRNLPVAGVVVSGHPADPDLATRTNLAELDRLSGGRLAGVVPALDRLDSSALAAATAWFGPPLGGTATRFG
jgi:dethiobiotin synthetase